jgi:TMEM175 potassium channel family protein
MGKARLEAFSDGVIAIIITIMVLDLKIPSGADMGAIGSLVPVFLNYVLSFVYVGIYWNNHHHLLHTVQRVSGGVLWANLHLLFWLSLFPFVTGWMGGNYTAAIPTAFYGVVLLMAALAYLVLERVIIANEGSNSLLARAVGGELKGRISVLLYALGIGVAFYSRVAAQLFYVTVALMWLVPDRRIERMVSDRPNR